MKFDITIQPWVFNGGGYWRSLTFPPKCLSSGLIAFSSVEGIVGSLYGNIFLPKSNQTVSIDLANTLMISAKNIGRLLCLTRTNERCEEAIHLQRLQRLAVTATFFGSSKLSSCCCHVYTRIPLISIKTKPIGMIHLPVCDILLNVTLVDL